MNIQRLRRALLRPWWPTPLRVGAIGALKAIPGPEAERALLDGLGVASPTVRGVVVLALNLREPPVPVETIVQAARTARRGPVPDPYRPPDVLEITELDLHQLGRLPLVEIAREGLASPVAAQRVAAVEVLQFAQDDAATAVLREARADPDTTISARAADALAYRAKVFEGPAVDWLSENHR